MSDGDRGDANGDGDEKAGNETSYLVEIKPSARRRSAAAGEHVRHDGRCRAFGSKALAREWVREHSTPDGRVWIQDTLSTDSSAADGYLVGGRRGGGSESGTIRGSQVAIGDLDVEE